MKFRTLTELGHTTQDAQLLEGELSGSPDRRQLWIKMLTLSSLQMFENHTWPAMFITRTLILFWYLNHPEISMTHSGGRPGRNGSRS